MLFKIFLTIYSVLGAAKAWGSSVFIEQYLDDGDYEEYEDYQSPDYYSTRGKVGFNDLFDAGTSYFLPQNPNDVTFQHFLSKSQKGRNISINCDYTCLSVFDNSAPVIFIVHGFMASSESGWQEHIRYALSSRSKRYNIIVVNWSPLAAGLNYPLAAANTRFVGKQIAELIGVLIREKITTMKKITYIGHSLGAQTSNFVAENLPVHEGEKLKLSRIIGLDPALPLFWPPLLVSEGSRLDSSDADFVVVIHTNAGGLGYDIPIGDVDFFPNAGSQQPGCSNVDFGTCSHGRSYYYLAEAIMNPSAFVASKCSSWTMYTEGKCDRKNNLYLQWDLEKRTRGVYYFATNDRSPFGMGKQVIIRANADM